MTPRYDEWRLHRINDVEPLSGIRISQMLVDEFPFEIELLKWEFEQEKATFAKKIAQLNKQNCQLKMVLYFRDGDISRAVKEKNHLK